MPREHLRYTMNDIERMAINEDGPNLSRFDVVKRLIATDSLNPHLIKIRREQRQTVRKELLVVITERLRTDGENLTPKQYTRLRVEQDRLGSAIAKTERDMVRHYY